MLYFYLFIYLFFYLKILINIYYIYIYILEVNNLINQSVDTINSSKNKNIFPIPPIHISDI